MEKRRISRILARADGAAVKRLADEIKAVQSPVIVKAPEKSLAMIRMREPVQESLFDLYYKRLDFASASLVVLSIVVLVLVIETVSNKVRKVIL